MIWHPESNALDLRRRRLKSGERELALGTLVLTCNGTREGLLRLLLTNNPGLALGAKHCSSVARLAQGLCSSGLSFEPNLDSLGEKDATDRGVSEPSFVAAVEARLARETPLTVRGNCE